MSFWVGFKRVGPPVEGMEQDLDPVVVINVVVAGLVGFIGLVLSPIDVGTIATLSYERLLAPSMVFALLAPVPGMVVGAVSLEGFRRESLLSLPLLGTGIISGRLFFIALFIAGSMIFASYKARSVYNGRNRFWSLFSVAGSIVFVLALVLGLFVGHTLLVQEDTRQEFRTSLTGEITNRTLVAVNATFNGDGQSVGESQQESIVRIVTTVSRNTSALTVQATEQLVMTRVQRASERFGKFDATEQQVLRGGFESAGQELPQQIAGRIRDRTNASMSGRSLRPSGDRLRQDVKGRVGGLLDLLFEEPRRVAAFGFVMVFSPLLMLKLPLSILFAGLAWVVLRVKHGVV